MLLYDAYEKYLTDFARDYYHPSEVEYHEFNQRTWHILWPDLDADNATPAQLLEWRDRLAEGKVRRPCMRNMNIRPRALTTVNRNQQTFIRAVTWMMTMQLMSTETHYRLAHVPYLRRGKNMAREPEPKLPVPEEWLDKVIAVARTESFRELLRLIRLSGMRPEEAASLHKNDIDKTTLPDVWIYNPRHHKTKYMGKGRIIMFGPQCQEIIKKFEAKKRLEDGPLFRNDRGTAWTPMSIRARIASTCQQHGIPHWHTSQLRKLRSNEVFDKYGLQGEEATLGHTAEVARKHYLMRDLKLAAEVAREIG